MRFIGTLCTVCSTVNITGAGGSSNYRLLVGKTISGTLSINTTSFQVKTITVDEAYSVQLQPSVSENKFLDMYDWPLRA